MSAAAAFVYLVPAGVCFAACALVYRRGRAPAWPRAVAAATPAAVIVAVAWAALRGLDYLAGWGGPAAWVRVTRDSGTDSAALAQVVLRVGTAAGVALGLGVIVAARWAKGGPRLPAATVASGAAAGGALLIGVAFATGPLAFSTALPLDLAAVIPAIASGFAVGFLQRPVPDPPTVRIPGALHLRAPADPPTVRIPGALHLRARSGVSDSPDADAEQVLSAAGVVAGSPAIEVVAERAAEVGDSVADRVWRACGGAGPAPAAVDRGGGVLVGDLPAPTGAALIDTVSILAMMSRAERVLIVARDPHGVRDRIAACVARLGAVPPGRMTAGEGELRDALARTTLPALVCLDLGQLAGEALRAETPDGQSWTALLDLIVLCEVDGLQPIEATHMAFTLRRLGLRLEQNRSRPRWFAVGTAGQGSLRYLEQATFTELAIAPLGARERAGLRVHVKTVSATDAPAAAIAAAADVLRDARVDVRCEDSVGDLRVKERPGYGGACSLALLDDRQLARMFRARGQLAHAIDGHDGHLAAWWVYDSPLASFLLRDDNLMGLEQQDALPAPAPVCGLGNPFLAAAHIEAALYEGRPDERGLRRAFGDAAFEELARVRAGELRRDGHRGRYDARAHAVERSPIVTAPGEQWPDPRRETVTANVVDVVDARGALLRRVDTRAAATRYYPHRVFRAAGALYQVPSEPLVAGARTLRVGPAPAGAVPTEPELAISIEAAEWLGTPKQHQIGGLSFARGVARVDVIETVTGAVARNTASATVRYAPVTARYSTVAVVVMFSRAPAKALYHVGRSARQMLPAHLLVGREDVDVLAMSGGLASIDRPSLVFVDRHIGGIGVADALDPQTLYGILFWSRNVLSRCSCLRGCPLCTPAEVLAAGPDKVQAIKLLGAR